VRDPVGRNSCRGYYAIEFTLTVRGCSSSANPSGSSDGAIEAGLRTLLPRAYAGSKGRPVAPTGGRELRPPALPGRE